MRFVDFERCEYDSFTVFYGENEKDEFERTNAAPTYIKLTNEELSEMKKGHLVWNDEDVSLKDKVRYKIALKRFNRWYRSTQK